MKKQMTIMKTIGSLYLLIASFSVCAASAYYQAGVNNLDGTASGLSINNATGAFFEHDIRLPRNGDRLSSYASANSQGTSMDLFGRTTTNSFITVAMGGVAFAAIGFDDIIFTDTANPGSSGTISVSVNIFNSLSTIITGTHSGRFSSENFTSAEFGGRVGLTRFPASTIVSNLFGGFMDGSDFTTGSVEVNLNTPYTLYFSSSLGYASNIHTDANFFASMGLGGSSGSGSAASLGGAGTNPFNLPSGYTVNSAQAGIVDNSLAAVPVPASVWLFISGMVGLFGVLKKHQK